MCTWMLCSSTTTPAHTRSISSSLLTTLPPAAANTEDVERPAAEPHRCFIAPQLAPREVKSEPAEADHALDHRNVPLENN
jgi:hypothetical protein